MSSSAHPRRRGGTSKLLRALLVVGFLFAMAATLLVIVSSDQLMALRIAVVLALWAALIAAFAVARSRREAQAVVAREAEITRTYELELHREVAARREYEAGLAATVHAELTEKQSTELAEIREQLERLSGTLSGLLDGDLLVQRLTVSAESTTVRSLGASGARAVQQAPVPPSIAGPADTDDAVVAETVESSPGSPVEPPRADAPTTAWALRHRRDVEEATAAVAAAMAAEPAPAEITDVVSAELVDDVDAAPSGSTPVGSPPSGSPPSGSTPVGSTPADAGRAAADVVEADLVEADVDVVEADVEIDEVERVDVIEVDAAEPDDRAGDGEGDFDAGEEYGSRIPVHQLLQAFGSGEQPRRHRRRADD